MRNYKILGSTAEAIYFISFPMYCEFLMCCVNLIVEQTLSPFADQRHLDVMQDLDDNVLLREYVERDSRGSLRHARPSSYQ